MQTFWSSVVAKGPAFVAGQLLGFFIILWSLLIYVQRERNRILAFKLAQDVMSVLQFVLCGAYTGAGVNTVMCLREIVFLHRGKRKWADHRAWLYIFIAFICLSTFLTSDQTPFTLLWYIGALPALGSSIAVVGLYNRSAHVARLCSLVGICLWLVYVLLMENWIQVVSNVISILSILVGLIGDARRRRAEKRGGDPASETTDIPV